MIVAMQRSASFPPAHETTSHLTWESQGHRKFCRPIAPGSPLKIDVGQVHYGHSRHWFLEVAALGLLTDIYPLADDIQHGKLTMIGEILSTFVSATPSRLRMIYDGHRQLDTTAHMMVISKYAISWSALPDFSKCILQDGHLDLFTFSDMSKLNMISYAMLSQIDILRNRHQALPGQTCKDPVESRMPVLADGQLLAKVHYLFMSMPML